MPKAIDLRLRGVKFEDALKRIISAKPMPKARKSKRATGKPWRKN